MPEFPGLFSVAEHGEQDLDLSRVLIALFKGVLYEEVNENLWHVLVMKQMSVRDYVRQLGLLLVLDEGEGYAYLTQEPAESGESLPRLIPKRPLSFVVSLLLTLLRKRLVESEASDGGRLILSRDDMVELLRVFLPSRNNEAKLVDQVQSAVIRVKEMGFIRNLQGQEDIYEVQRIVKAFVDAEWLADLDEKLTVYLASKGIATDQGED